MTRSLPLRCRCSLSSQTRDPRRRPDAANAFRTPRHPRSRADEGKTRFGNRFRKRFVVGAAICAAPTRRRRRRFDRRATPCLFAHTGQFHDAWTLRDGTRRAPCRRTRPSRRRPRPGSIPGVSRLFPRTAGRRSATADACFAHFDSGLIRNPTPWSWTSPRIFFARWLATLLPRLQSACHPPPRRPCHARPGMATWKKRRCRQRARQ
mmetsp:Transcript_4977/g.18504  ORF Transcript_4977/g.18504 Transcript_4977/m.18504 type:complete len:207 (+) Transcript_4977:3653-4273(+)